MDKAERTKLRRAVTWFENAVREHEMRGTQRPEDQDYIESNYYRAKANLLRKLGVELDAAVLRDLANER